MNQKGFVSTSILVTILVLVAIGGAYYLGTQKSGSLSLPPSVPSTLQTAAPSSTPQMQESIQPTPNTTAATWKTYTDNTHIAFQYPSDWTVGTLFNTSEDLVIQPTSSYVPNSQNNAIIIGTTESCLNTQCLTILDLKGEEQNFGSNLTVLGTVQAKNAIGDKVMTPFSKNYEYWFVQGKDFVIVSTDKYPQVMDQVVSTLQLLAPSK